jgi:hypothetical protein
MEERMLSMYADMDDETEEEFMANYPPQRPGCQPVDLSSQTEEIMYRTRLAIGELIECWDNDGLAIDEVAEIRKMRLLLDIWYESSPLECAWQEYRKADLKYQAKKLAEIEKEELEF